MINWKSGNDFDVVEDGEYIIEVDQGSRKDGCLFTKIAHVYYNAASGSLIDMNYEEMYYSGDVIRWARVEPLTMLEVFPE